MYCEYSHTRSISVFNTVEYCCTWKYFGARYSGILSVLEVFRDPVLLVLRVLAVFQHLVLLILSILGGFKDLILRGAVILAVFQGFILRGTAG